MSSHRKIILLAAVLVTSPVAEAKSKSNTSVVVSPNGTIADSHAASLMRRKISPSFVSRIYPKNLGTEGSLMRNLNNVKLPEPVAGARQQPIAAAALKESVMTSVQLAGRSAQVPVAVAQTTAAPITAVQTTAAPGAVATPGATPVAKPVATPPKRVPVGPAAEESFFQQQMYVLVAFGLAGIAIAFALLVPQAKRQEALKRPYSMAAYSLGTVLFFQFLVMSVPFTGFLFGGCMWNSIHGIGTAVTLAGACMVPGLKLFEVNLPPAIPEIGHRSAAYALAAAGGMGISLASVWGSNTCAVTFLGLNIALVFNALLLGMAWYTGEGGGILGWLRG